jgi:uncharacterized protein
MNMRALVLCNDLWHPAHVARRGLEALASRGFSFDWLEDAGDWSPDRLAEHPLVVLAKSNHVSATDQRPWLTPEGQGAFAEHVRQGGGLVVIHSGTAGYGKLPVMRALTGGAFLHHPPQCAVTVEPHHSHTLTNGAAAFTLEDEHYFVALDDERADVFLHTRSEHGVQPAGWTRAEGKGRVCVLTPGHNLEVWLAGPFQILLSNALRWAAKTI